MYVFTCNVYNIYIIIYTHQTYTYMDIYIQTYVHIYAKADLHTRYYT